jgi:hypothetical protein
MIGILLVADLFGLCFEYQALFQEYGQCFFSGILKIGVGEASRMIGCQPCTDLPTRPWWASFLWSSGPKNAKFVHEWHRLPMRLASKILI